MDEILEFFVTLPRNQFRKVIYIVKTQEPFSNSQPMRPASMHGATWIRHVLPNIALKPCTCGNSASELYACAKSRVPECTKSIYIYLYTFEPHSHHWQMVTLSSIHPIPLLCAHCDVSSEHVKRALRWNKWVCTSISSINKWTICSILILFGCFQGSDCAGNTRVFSSF